MKTIFNVLVSLLVVSILVFSLFSSEVYSAEKTITLQMTNFLPAGMQVSLAMDKWAKDVEAATSGRVKVKTYHGATMASALQQYDAATKGIAEVCNHVLGYTVGRFPLSEVIDLPLGIPNGVVASKMMNEYYGKFKPKEFDDVKVLWLHGQGPGYLATRAKAVQKLEDLKGLKIRTYGGNARFMLALGGTPVAMPMTEVYDALSRGMVDGLLSALESLESFRTGEHIKYVTTNKWTAYTACMLVAMNKKTWNSLPPDIQKIIDRISQDQPEAFGMAWDRAEQIGKAFLAKRNVQYVSLTGQEEQRWIDKGAQPLFDDYVKRMKEKNLPGDQALRFILDYLKPYKK